MTPSSKNPRKGHAGSELLSVVSGDSVCVYKPWSEWYREEGSIPQAVVTCGALEPDHLGSNLAVGSGPLF